MEEKNSKKNDKVIRDAQYRKGLSIAFFNASNSAIEMVKMEGPKFIAKKVKKTGAGIKFTQVEVPLRQRIKEWREVLLEDHKEYYATVIANVGVNYRSEDSIKKLKTVKSMSELKALWLGFSEDERRDGEIKEVAKALKEKFKEK